MGVKERWLLGGAVAAIAGLLVVHEVRASAPPRMVGGPLRGVIIDPFAPEAPAARPPASTAGALRRGHLVDPFASDLMDPFAGASRSRGASQTPALKLGFLVDPFRYDQDRGPARRDALVDPFAGERARKAPDAAIVDPFL